MPLQKMLHLTFQLPIKTPASKYLFQANMHNHDIWNQFWLMLARSVRRWFNIKPTLAQHWVSVSCLPGWTANIILVYLLSIVDIQFNSNCIIITVTHLNIIIFHVHQIVHQLVMSIITYWCYV